MLADPDTLWLFGYGSLIWRPDFEAVQASPGYIKGFVRRFYQGSPDHRGVPHFPGRVVTLLPDHPESITWGMAYALKPEAAARILSQLDEREKGGYERHNLTVYRPTLEPIQALVYMATSTNPHYLGPAPLDQIAQTILDAHGPSGPNLEYLLKLHDSLRALGAQNKHVAALVQATQALRER